MTKFERTIKNAINEAKGAVADAIFYEDERTAESWYGRLNDLRDDLDNYRAQVAEDEEAMKLENKLCGYIR